MKALTILGITFLIGYAQNWGAYYISLVSEGNLRIEGSIRNYEEPCTPISLSNPTHSICKTQYRLPKTIWKQQLDNSQSTQHAIGLGYIIWASQIYCNNNTAPLATFGDFTSPGSSLDTFNHYQVIQISGAECNDDLIVQAWSKPSYRRYGHMDSPIVIGAPADVGKVSAFFDFFRFPLLLIIVALFTGIFIFNQMMLKLFSHRTDKTAFELFGKSWLGYALAYSGVLTSLIPLLSGYQIIFRAGNALASLAIIGSCLSLIEKSHSHWSFIQKLASQLISPIKKLLISPLEVAAIFYAISPYFATAVGPIYLVSGISFLLYGMISKNQTLSAISICAISDGLKVFMVGGLPFSMMLLVFVLIHQWSSFASRTRKAVLLLDDIRWSKDYVSKTEGKNIELQTLLSDLARRIEVKQFAYFIPEQGGYCRIQVCKFIEGLWCIEPLYRNAVPPVFAHVMSTREPIFHVEENSIFAINLRKGEIKKQQYSGRHFTIIPLLENGLPIGALSLTNYSEEIPNDEIQRMRFETAISLLLPLITRKLSHQRVTVNSEWITKCASVSEKILNLDPNENDFFNRITDLLSQQLGVGLFLGQIDLQTRQISIKAIAGYPKNIKNSYLKFKFFAVAHNEQGPIPLAVNRKKIVTHPDFGWIKGVLHPESIKLGEAFATQSCAAVPLQIDGDVWGVLWIESVNIGFFNAQCETGLAQIEQSIELSISKMKLQNAHNRVKETLAGFVPAHILPKLINGDSVREEEIGYLLMADLRDSTKLSRHYGSEKWSEFVKKLCPPSEAIAKEFGFTLQTVIWDAFYFTSDVEKSTESLERAIAFANKLTHLYNISCIENFKEVLENIESGDRARFCLVYGDITRDLKGSLTANWTIVGTAMASVSKLEQTCKMYEGLFFCTQSVAPALQASVWNILPEKTRSSMDEVYRYKGNVSTLSVSSDIKKVA